MLLRFFTGFNISKIKSSSLYAAGPARFTHWKQAALVPKDMVCASKWCACSRNHVFFTIT